MFADTMIAILSLMSFPCWRDVSSCKLLQSNCVTMKNQSPMLKISSKYCCLFLSFWERVLPTLIRPKPKNFCVGFLPSSNGVRRFTIGTCCFQFKRVCDSNLDPSDLRIGDQFWIWDPGINDYVHNGWVMDSWMGHLDFNRIAISTLLSAFQNQQLNANGIRSRQWVIKSPSILSNSFQLCEVKDVTPLSFWSLIEWVINKDEDSIISKKYKRLETNNGIGSHGDFLFLRTQSNGGDVFGVPRSGYSDSMKQEIMVINEPRWVGRYKRHDQEPFQATYQCICLIRVMRKAFGSFIYKMIVFYEYMKRGLNRFYLLPVRLLLESRVTSTSSSKLAKLGFNFLYLFQWLYLNGFMYHVSCKTFMK